MHVSGHVCPCKRRDVGSPFVCTWCGPAGGLPVQGLHKIAMVLGSTADQMADLLPACTQMACWGVLRF